MSSPASSSSPFRLVIFDLDGTLVDSLPDIAGALNEALAEAGFPLLAPEQVRAFVGEGAARLVERALASNAAPGGNVNLIDAVTGRFRRCYAQRLLVATRPYPGVEAVLRRLASVVPLAIVTNKPNELARPLLVGLGLAELFADVMADGDGFARKPSPDVGRWLLARHGASPETTLVVGDGVPDMRFARALAAPAAAVTWGYVEPDTLRAERPAWLIDQPADLLSIVLGTGAHGTGILGTGVPGPGALG